MRGYLIGWLDNPKATQIHFEMRLILDRGEAEAIVRKRRDSPYTQNPVVWAMAAVEVELWADTDLPSEKKG